MNIKNKHLSLIFIATGYVSLLFSFPVLADDAHHEYPSHALGVFLGATDPEEESADFSFGGEYELRINQYIGVGGIVERTPQGHEGDGVTVALGAVHIHPVGALRITGGIGSEMVDDHDSETLYRLGAAYDFELPNSFAIAPTVNVDFVDGKETLVFGATLSRHF